MNAAKAVLPVFLLTIVLGCGSEPDDEVFGTFTLVGVEGSPLPYLETNPGHTGNVAIRAADPSDSVVTGTFAFEAGQLVTSLP